MKRKKLLRIRQSRLLKKGRNSQEEGGSSQEEGGSSQEKIYIK